MIQISQEELFRRIRLEHNCNLDSEQEREQASQHHAASSQGGAGAVLDACEGANSTNTDSPVKPSLREASTSASLTTGSSLAAGCGGRLGHAMSFLLPTGAAAPTCGADRDGNNNQTCTADDEVQAVLITGCGSKIGSKIAAAFATRGLKVALVDFDIQQTEAVAHECVEKSPKHRVPLQIVADISQLAEAHKVIDRTIEAFGRLDVLVNTVNNASLMAAKFAGAGDDDPHVFEQYHKIIANNMHAVTYLCISAAPYLRKTKGSIVNVSSITNNETGSYKFAYCMSKAGISTLTKCLATDLAPDIKVICVCPKSDSS